MSRDDKDKRIQGLEAEANILLTLVTDLMITLKMYADGEKDPAYAEMRCTEIESTLINMYNIQEEVARMKKEMGKK